MKRFIVASVAALALASASAWAADLPAPPEVYKAAPSPAPAYSWTGFYLDAGGGYGIWSADTTTLSPAGTCVLCVTQTQGGNGYFGRVGLGYDQQIGVPLGTWTPQLVGGLFADTDLSSLKGTIQDQLPFFAASITENWSWAAGSRIGWLVTPQSLTYANFGFTQTHFNGAAMIGTGTGVPSGFTTPAFSRTGWFVGGGVETPLTPILPAGFSLRTEYRYAYYGTAVVPEISAAGAVPASITVRPNVQTISTVLVYKFNAQPLPGVSDTAPLAYKSPPALVANWSGFYLNGGAGYGMWSADTTTVSPATGACILCATQTQGGRGWFGTFGGGFDYQFSVPIGPWTPKIVAGPFADANLAGLRGTIQDQTPFFAGTTTENWSWAAGARVGWLATPQILSYVNGGFTQAHFTGASMIITGSPSGFPAGTASGFSTPAVALSGWFLGGGVETSLASVLPAGWFLRSDYRYAYYGTVHLTDTCAIACVAPVGLPPGTLTFHPTVQTASTSLVYKFNWTP